MKIHDQEDITKIQRHHPLSGKLRLPDLVYGAQTRSIKKYRYIWRYLEENAYMDLGILYVLKTTFEEVATMLPEAVAERDGEKIVEWMENHCFRPRHIEDMFTWMIELDNCRTSWDMDILESTCAYMDSGEIDVTDEEPKTAENYLKDCMMYRFICELEYCVSPEFRKKYGEEMRTALAQSIHPSSRPSVAAASTEATGGWGLSSLDENTLESISRICDFNNTVPDWFRYPNQ